MLTIFTGLISFAFDQCHVCTGIFLAALGIVWAATPELVPVQEDADQPSVSFVSYYKIQKPATRLLDTIYINI